MTSPRLFLLACLLEFSAPAMAQVIETEDGPVEFFGLSTWTAEMIRDSLAVYSPGTSLSDAACMVVLREDLGFPEAGVIIHNFDGPYRPENVPPKYTMILVVEPARADRIAYAPLPPVREPPRPEWEALHAIRAEHLRAFRLAIQRYPWVAHRAGAPLPPFYAEDPDLPRMREVWDHLKGRDAEADRQAALWTLSHDASPDNRVIATAILVNFPEHDSTWWTLAELARTRDEAATHAAMLLYALAVHAPRTVDWEPALPALRALFEGTNIMASAHLHEALERTRISPALAPELLPGRADILLDYLGSMHPMVRKSPHALLVRMRGQDLGDDVAAWRSWIESL